jgi:hypothetical protein
MVTQIKQRQSIFPDFPRGTPTVDKNGNFTENWRLGLSSVFQGLQKNFTNEGIQIPQLPESDLDTIEAPYTALGSNLKPLGLLPNIAGKMVYDTTNNVPKMFIIVFQNTDDPSSNVTSASWKTFTLT